MTGQTALVKGENDQGGGENRMQEAKGSLLRNYSTDRKVEETGNDGLRNIAGRVARSSMRVYRTRTGG